MNRVFSSLALLLCVALLAACATSPRGATDDERYAKYVWPSPPDEPRIRLVDILGGRLDVEAESRLARTLIGVSPQSPYDSLEKPTGVAIDASGRVLVTDSGLAALIRFDRKERRMDVLGVRGTLRLKLPLSVMVSRDDLIYVTDAGLARVIVFDENGEILRAYGSPGQMVNPTGSALSLDGTRLFVCDSKAHQIVVFDVETASEIHRFGSRGEGEGEFSFPTTIAVDLDGSLFVVDQLNARVQILTPDGEFLDQLGSRGRSFGQFSRPKDIAIGEDGLIYVTDSAFNNVQIFDSDLNLLTFVGSGGSQPGQFAGISGVSVREGQVVLADSLGSRVQLFRHLRPADRNRE